MLKCFVLLFFIMQYIVILVHKQINKLTSAKMNLLTILQTLQFKIYIALRTHIYNTSNTQLCVNVGTYSICLNNSMRIFGKIRYTTYYDHIYMI